MISCLRAVSGAAVVYVDSSSTDGSVQAARALGADVVELDLGIPFTAARARNAGFARLETIVPDVACVQFVDGDCELASGWTEAAVAFLDAHADAAAVCGRLRERYPDRSVYNWLCDREWDRPTGEVRAFAGNVMIRAAALRSVGGYREDVIAGEEEELSVRLRQANWRIWRLADEMALHDAAMLHFKQWWKRTAAPDTPLRKAATCTARHPSDTCARGAPRGRLGHCSPPRRIIATIGFPIRLDRLARLPDAIRATDHQQPRARLGPRPPRFLSASRAFPGRPRPADVLARPPDASSPSDHRTQKIPTSRNA